MKLKTITIRGFRGFNEQRTLVLGDTNIFGGPNGFGKTSVFDAVQWCLFGTVSRLSGTRDFVRAGNVLGNKFSADGPRVAVELQNGETQYHRARTLNTCTSQIDGKRVEDREFLETIGFGGNNPENKFLRYFVLQQERVNDFVKDLNPRDRYDAFVTFLEFASPERVSGRLSKLEDSAKGVHAEVLAELSLAESRKEQLQADVLQLDHLRTTTSSQIVLSQLTALRNESRTKVPIPEFADETSPETIPSFVANISQSLREFQDLESMLSRLVPLQPPSIAVSESEFANLAATVAGLRESVGVLDLELESIQSKLTSVREAVVAEDHSRNALVALLTNARSYVDSDICPVCQRPMEKSVLLEKIDAALKQAPAKVTSLAEERLTLEQQLQEKQAVRNADAVALQQREQELAALQQPQRQRVTFQAELEKIRRHPRVVSLNLQNPDLSALVEIVSNLVRELEGLERRAVQLLSLDESVNLVTLLPGRQSQLTEAERSVDDTGKRKQGWDSVLELIRQSLREVHSVRQELVAQTLERNKPLIENLYRRLQPHPLFTEIDLEVVTAYKEAELYFRVFSRDRSASANPATVFSSSQLNALAVCIFIALSLRAHGPLKILMLDDPIYSMDDINVLGLCDLLRQLKTQRQLFISTHSNDFRGLLMNKLRPLNPSDEVKTFIFEGWSRSGPEIREEIVRPLQMPIELPDLMSKLNPSVA
jgi:DNA repair exonuclease SbcCD ATPase subunit